jgi:hypothetical protein
MHIMNLNKHKISIARPLKGRLFRRCQIVYTYQYKAHNDLATT